MVWFSFPKSKYMGPLFSHEQCTLWKSRQKTHFSQLEYTYWMCDFWAIATLGYLEALSSRVFSAHHICDSGFIFLTFRILFYREFTSGTNGMEVMQNLLTSDNYEWTKSDELVSVLRTPLMRLCVRYSISHSIILSDKEFIYGKGNSRDANSHTYLVVLLVSNSWNLKVRFKMKQQIASLEKTNTDKDTSVSEVASVI